MPGSNLILIGYRGTGKSTVAQHLALSLGWDWADADVELELRAGKSIAAIFAEQGEPAFRDLECQVIADLCQRQKTVVAAGGGAVLREENRRAIQAGGRAVWLRASPEAILARVESDAATAQRRPNLTVAGGAAEVRQLLAARTPLYQACATVIIDTDGKTPRQVVDEIIQLCRLPRGS
ncbi:MAG: shikimate kinase [Pirellulales bacterium]